MKNFDPHALGHPWRGKPARSIYQRFMDFVEFEANSGCWLWSGTLNADGYGHLRIDRRMVGAHVVSAIIHFGSIPDDACVLHKCDVRACCNPAHLYIGDQKLNARDRERRGRGNHPARERHRLSKLTTDKVRAIRAMTLARTEQREIAKQLGLGRCTVWRVQTGRLWADVQ